MQTKPGDHRIVYAALFCARRFCCKVVMVGSSLALLLPPLLVVLSATLLTMWVASGAWSIVVFTWACFCGRGSRNVVTSSVYKKMSTPDGPCRKVRLTIHCLNPESRPCTPAYHELVLTALFVVPVSISVGGNEFSGMLEEWSQYC
jgi:hypothetical protein